MVERASTDREAAMVTNAVEEEPPGTPAALPVGSAAAKWSDRLSVEDMERTMMRPAHTPSAELSFAFSTGQEIGITGDGVIGRNPHSGDPDAQLVRIPDPGREISRCHLAFGLEEGGVWVMDLASANGTRVIQAADHPAGRLTPEMRYHLTPGDTLELGPDGDPIGPGTVRVTVHARVTEPGELSTTRPEQAPDAETVTADDPIGPSETDGPLLLIGPPPAASTPAPVPLAVPVEGPADEFRCPECDDVVPAGAAGCGSCGTSILPPIVPAAAEELVDTDGAPSHAQPSTDATEAVLLSVAPAVSTPVMLALPPTRSVAPTGARDLTEGLFQVPAPGSALVRHPARQHRRSLVARVSLIVGACTVAAVAVIGGGVWIATASTTSPPAHTSASSTAPQPKVVTLPGFDGTSTWAGTTRASAATVSSDGKLLGQITATRAVVTGADGKRPVSIPGIVRFIAGTVDGHPSLVGISATSASVFTMPGAKPATVPLPDEATLVSRGAGVLVLSGPGLSTVGVLTSTGVTACSAPAPGMVSAGLLPDGAVRWVSARGLLYTASAAGTAATPIQLAAPAADARVSHALWTTNTTVITTWLLPDGSTVVAAHTVTDGTLTGQAATSDPNPRLLVSRDGSTAMAGAARLDLSTGTVTVPDPAFQATVVLAAGSFYGGTGSKTAVQSKDGKTTPVPDPQGTPVGVTANGSLVFLPSTGPLAVYPPASPSRNR
ncbi:FHA domain-containing protein [Leifsonia aquatica]|uniref:FHA domain-containing protein n=1 Tax=Leifsonia aquatica TaxID=144185 RepID=UPI003810FBEE